MTRYPQMIRGIFSKGRNRLMWVSFHRVQIGADEQQNTSTERARGANSLFVTGQRPPKGLLHPKTRTLFIPV